MGTKPLLLPEQADRALRDLMPVIEAITDADLMKKDGAGIRASTARLEDALDRLRAIPADSPAIAAYLTWLEQNTEATP